MYYMLPGPERRAEPGLGPDRLSGAARASGEPAAARARAARGRARHRDRLRRRRGRLGRRRRHRRGRAGAGGPRRGRARGRRLLRRRRLRRRRVLGALAHVPVRRWRGNRTTRASACWPGSCLGGGTTVNYTTSFRTPDDVREEWASHGVPAFATDQYAQQPRRRLRAPGRQPGAQQPVPREQVMHQGLVALGWHSDIMPRNVRGCDQGKRLRLLRLRLPLWARSSRTVKTWLARRRAGGRPHPRAHEGRPRSSWSRAAPPASRRARWTATRSRCDREPWCRPAERFTRPALLRRSGLSQSEHRQAPAPAPGHGRLGRLRRGDPPLGGHDAGRLLRPAPLPRRRLRRQVRDGRASPHAAGVVRALAQRAAARRDDAVALAHDGDRSAAA